MKKDHAVLSDFCQIIQGGRLKLSGNDFVSQGVPAYGAGGLNGYLDIAEFNCEAVVLSAIGARCGKCFYANGDWTSLANTQIIIPDPERANCRFLWHQLNDEKRWHRSGTGQPFIKPSDVKAHKVFLPPLEEQRHIATILDKANRITLLQEDARSVAGNLPRSLFLSLFGDPRVNPHPWPEYTLGELGRVVTGSTPPSSLDGMFNGAIPFVTPGDLGSGFEPRRSLTEAGALRSRIVRRGSALVCCIGATIGKMDIAQQDSAFNQQINAVEWGDAVIGEYGIESLRFLKDAIATTGASTTLPILKKSSFEKLRIPVPPIDIQRDYAQRLKAIDPYLAKLHNAAQHGAALRQAVTARAFFGELLA